MGNYFGILQTAKHQQYSKRSFLDQVESMENRLARGGRRKIFTRRVHRELLTTFNSDCEEDQLKKLCRIAPANLSGSGEKRATDPQPKTSFSATVAKKDRQRHQDGKAK